MKSTKPEYRSWSMMQQRCYNPRAVDYRKYGARGIAVCERWRGPGGFERFAADMGPRPAGMTLDRIDGRKGYAPDNCRWADIKTQNRNRSCTTMLTVDGETKPLTEWAEIKGVPADALSQRVRAGWSAAAAVLTPVRTKDVGLVPRLRALPVGGEVFLPGKTPAQASSNAKSAWGVGNYRLHKEADGTRVRRVG